MFLHVCVFSGGGGGGDPISGPRSFLCGGGVPQSLVTGPLPRGYPSLRSQVLSAGYPSLRSQIHSQGVPQSQVPGPFWGGTPVSGRMTFTKGGTPVSGPRSFPSGVPQSQVPGPFPGGTLEISQGIPPPPPQETEGLNTPRAVCLLRLSRRTIMYLLLYLPHMMMVNVELDVSEKTSTKFQCCRLY